MYFFGISLNILSMMGLMLAIGMLVDNAVVVTENIFRRRQMDPDNPKQATLLGTREVATAVTAGTLTTIIVFVPIIFGEKIDITVFLEHVAITIVVSLLASLFISLTIIPMIASRVKVPVEKPGGLIQRFKKRYRAYLVWALDRRWRVSLSAMAMLMLGFGIMGSPAVKKEMFPQDTQRRLFMPYHLENTYSLARVEKAVFNIEDYLYGNAEEFEIREVYSYFEGGRAESTILLTEEGDKTVLEIQDLIRKDLPNIVIGKPSFDLDQSGSSEGVGLQILLQVDEHANLNRLVGD